MTGRFISTLPILAALSLSCMGPKRHRPDHAEKPLPLLIWIDPAAQIHEADTLQACEEWKAKGIRCFLVSEKAKSHIQVYAENDTDCIRNKGGTYTLALAWRGGRIVFNMKCFGKIGSPDRHKFRAVMVHEIGHHLGIWNHVPEDCEADVVKMHPTGKPICGQAVMNPLYEKDIHFVTPIDGLAFDVRDRDIAVVVDLPAPETPETPDCTYLGR